MINYSFIIPHHNVPNLLNRLLESIPQREDIEIIVVDDNSDEDKKPSITRKDVRLIVLSKEESKGAGHARNVGLDKARGKWLLFADSDDYYLPGFITVLDKYRECDIDILYFNIFSEVSNSDQLNILERYMNSEQSHHDRCVLGFSNNAPWNKMFSRDFIYYVGEKFEEIPSSNDAWFTNIMAVKSRKIAVEKSILYRYVNNPSGITGRVRPISDRYIVLESIIRRNKLKYENGCSKLIDIGFGFHRYAEEYGFAQAIRYGLYRFLKDKYLRIAILKKIWNL